MKHCELELHIKRQHQTEKDYECELCDKRFVLKWRMLKHQESHRDPRQKKCHYFNNRKTCPFDELGCMFAHETSEMCKFDNICCNKLCPFQHTINQQENQNSDDNEEKDIAGEKELNLTDEYDDDEMEMEPKYFQTSTPKKREIECEGGIELGFSSCSTSGSFGGANSRFS